MFDGPKYYPPIKMPEAAQIQPINRYPHPPDYSMMVLHILGEISEYIQPDGVFGPQIVHTLVTNLEMRLLGVSENDRDTAIKKASKEIANDMLTVVNKKIVDREPCEKIHKVVSRELKEEVNRSVKQLTDYKKNQYFGEESSNLLGLYFDGFGELTVQSILSYSLYVFISMNILQLAGEDTQTDAEQDTQRKAQERRKKISDLLKRLLTWVVIIIIALIIITMFILVVTWEMGV
jgi:hypothetical protein